MDLVRLTGSLKEKQEAFTLVTIPGASGFLGAATLANLNGTPAAQATVLGEGGIGSVSLLDVGRSSLFDSGVGLSASARALNKQFLESSSSTFNQIFSLGLGTTASIEGLQQEILALRSSVPEGKLASSLLAEDDGGVAASETGQEVDTEA